MLTALLSFTEDVVILNVVPLVNGVST